MHMQRRLVELDPQTRYTKELDLKRLQREARDLQAFLLALKPEDDKLGLRKRILPFCESALDGRLTRPLHPSEKPLNIMRILDNGDTLPQGFEELYARFFNTALGARADVENKIAKDGKLWAWMEFE